MTSRLSCLKEPRWQDAQRSLCWPTPLEDHARPAEWLAALNDAISRNAIPNVPLSTNDSSGVPVYPEGVNATSPEVCSGTYQCQIPGDVWNGPDSHIGLAFDDGPEEGTAELIAYLKTINQQVTHFMIGSNILDSPDLFIQEFELGNDIAVHTWTHPYMTTQSNESVVAELGWTMQIIHNSTGGRVPRFWRPPYGDTDARVSAIAKEVFGLTTIVWNQDTNDWSLTDSPPGTTAAQINASMYEWLNGPTTPGLIILEHELSNQSVAAFKSAYPVMQNHTQWTIMSLAQLIGNGTSYMNADNSTSPVNAVDVINAKSASPPSASSPSSESQTPGQLAGSGAPSSPSSTPGSKPNSAPSGVEIQPTAMLSAAVAVALFVLWT